LKTEQLSNASIFKNQPAPTNLFVLSLLHFNIRNSSMLGILSKFGRHCSDRSLDPLFTFATAAILAEPESVAITKLIKLKLGEWLNKGVPQLEQKHLKSATFSIAYLARNSSATYLNSPDKKLSMCT
jgi:hypothetical protein